MTDLTGKYLKHRMQIGRETCTQYLRLERIDTTALSHGDWVTYQGVKVQFGENHALVAILLHASILIAPDRDSERTVEIDKEEFWLKFYEALKVIQQYEEKS